MGGRLTNAFTHKVRGNRLRCPIRRRCDGIGALDKFGSTWLIVCAA